MNSKIWMDTDGMGLKIRQRSEKAAVRFEATCFDADSLATLDEIIACLQEMRGVFAPQEYFDWAGGILRLLDTPDTSPVVGTRDLLLCFRKENREAVKIAVLFMGDSRRPDRELDLSRDDRTEAMMTDEEKELMPSETIDGKTRWYCTVQRRMK